jgi:hypothetical protein
VENLFAGLKNNVEKMFEKKNLPIDPLPQMSWVHRLVLPYFIAEFTA